MPTTCSGLKTNADGPTEVRDMIGIPLELPVRKSPPRTDRHWPGMGDIQPAVCPGRPGRASGVLAGAVAAFFGSTGILCSPWLERLRRDFERLTGVLPGLASVSRRPRSAAPRSLASSDVEPILFGICGKGRRPVSGRRRGVFAALSDDGGRTWAHCRALDGVLGYLSVAQAPNGIICVFGSRMSCAAFNEAWLKEGKPIDQRV